MSLREDIAQAIRVAWVEDAEAGRSKTTAETLADAVVALVEARDAQVTGSTVVAWAEQRGYKRAEAALRERLARDIEALIVADGNDGTDLDEVLALVRGGGAA